VPQASRCGRQFNKRIEQCESSVYENYRCRSPGTPTRRYRRAGQHLGMFMGGVVVELVDRERLASIADDHRRGRNPRQLSMGFVPENQVRTRLPAGAGGIRTFGPRNNPDLLRSDAPVAQISTSLPSSTISSGASPICGGIPGPMCIRITRLPRNRGRLADCAGAPALSGRPADRPALRFLPRDAWPGRRRAASGATGLRRATTPTELQCPAVVRDIAWRALPCPRVPDMFVQELRVLRCAEPSCETIRPGKQKEKQP
jgi:hypothetical protein